MQMDNKKINNFIIKERMKKMKKFYICRICGNIIEYINESGRKVVCCNKEMEELIPNTEEASHEKHIPIVEINNNEIIVTVGSTIHPSTEEHYIKNIIIVTTKGSHNFKLEPGMLPVITYTLQNEVFIGAYAYCNIHGLWINK